MVDKLIQGKHYKIDNQVLFYVSKVEENVAIGIRIWESKKTDSVHVSIDFSYPVDINWDVEEISETEFKKAIITASEKIKLLVGIFNP